MAAMSETPLESEAVKLWPDDPSNSIAMPTNRRDFLLTGATLPLITACATDITQLGSRPVADLAKDLGVCAASYTVLQKGMPSSPVALTGCDAEPRPDAVFQAASLTKPVVAFAALQLALVGRLNLDAPVSTYLPQGYRHFHRILARSDNDAHDVVPVGSLVPLASRKHMLAALPRALCPAVQWEGHSLVALPHMAAAFRVKDLGTSQGNLRSKASELVGALDAVSSGV